LFCLELIAFLNDYNQPYLDLSLEFLENYKQFNSNIYIKVIKILYERTESGITEVNFHLLFNPFTEIFKKLKNVFKKDIDLLKKIYLYQRSIDNVTDHDSQVLRIILERESSFILEYLDWLQDSDKYVNDMSDQNKYSSLWYSENYTEIFDKILSYYKDSSLFLASHHIINVFFKTFDDDDVTIRLDYIKKKFRESTSDIKMIKLLFIIISNNFPIERLYFISLFTKVNKNIDDFRKLYLERDSIFSGPTFVPIYEDRIKFWKSVRDCFSSADLLQHRRFAELRISDYKRSIKEELRRNFSDD